MPALPAIGSLVADKYRIEALIGEGGMGAVYRAHHVIMEKDVAIKVLHPELSENPDAQQRFLREARAVAAIDHAHVVKIHDVGSHGDNLFMVMEFLQGETLELGLIKGSIALPQALRLILASMEGVAAGHEKDIVHRDIKSDNIFVARDPKHADGVAKVLDFGISKRTVGNRETQNITRTGSVMGTPAYMSMEQLTASKEIDARSDIYAFGVLLYRTLTGRLPYSGENFSAVAVQMLTNPARPPSQVRNSVPPAFDAIVMKAIATDAGDRYALLSDLSAALRALCQSLGYLEPDAPPSTASAVRDDSQPALTFATADTVVARPRSRGARLALGAGAAAIGLLLWAAARGPDTTLDTQTRVQPAAATPVAPAPEPATPPVVPAPVPGASAIVEAPKPVEVAPAPPRLQRKALKRLKTEPLKSEETAAPPQPKEAKPTEPEPVDVVPGRRSSGTLHYDRL